jgi:hypothetical protein
MNNKSFLRLSSAGLRNAISPIYENTFQFIVDGHSYFCKPFVADFLSPRIGRARLLDPTLDHFDISTKDPLNEFKALLSVCEGFPIAVTPSLAELLISIAQELDNSEILEQLISGLGEVCIENAGIRLKVKLSAGLESEKEVKFVCQHFAELWGSIKTILDVNDLFFVMSNDLLTIPKEDWLLGELIDFVGSDFTKFELFETVYFEAVSVDIILQFTTFISPFFEDISKSLWERLSRRLICELKSQSEIPNFLRSRYSLPPNHDINYKSGCPFDGIISYLTRKHGGNLTELGIVNATSSTCYSGDWAAKWCIDHRCGKSFCSQDAPNQWLQLDFKEASIVATHYSIQSRKDVPNGAIHPRSWVVEVGSDGTAWSVVDRRGNDNHLNGRELQYTFDIATPTAGRYFRLRQTGVNHHTGHCFTLMNLEIFGRLICEVTTNKQTSKGTTCSIISTFRGISIDSNGDARNADDLIRINREFDSNDLSSMALHSLKLFIDNSLIESGIRSLGTITHSPLIINVVSTEPSLAILYRTKKSLTWF